MLVIPPPPLIKVASNTRPYSKLRGTTLNGREEGGQYYILQTGDQERFEARKVVFPWECLIIFATGCSTLILFNGIVLLLLRVEEHRTRHQNGMGKRVTLSLIYDKCMGILMCANGVETKEKRIYLR